MCHGADGEFPALAAANLHDPEDEHVDHLLAAIKPALHHVDAVAHGAGRDEADFCGR